MNKNDEVVLSLQELGLTIAEAEIYLELLRKPSTHAQLSQATGVNRTTLYRIVDKLEKRGILMARIDDRGKFLVANNPHALEVDVVDQEESAKKQRLAFSSALPKLEAIQKGYSADFTIHTYEGVDGFKRMLWHELKTVGECLVMGGAPVEGLGLSRQFSEKQRQLSVEANYCYREISNPGLTPTNFTKNKKFLKSYQLRVIPREILPINHLTAIYNDTVAIYNVYEGRQMGLEIVSKTYVKSARSIFESFWSQATPAKFDSK